MGDDYFARGLKSGQHKLPKIFRVNWFRKHSAGSFLWARYGEDSRMLAGCSGDATGALVPGETPSLPVSTEGRELAPTMLQRVLRVDGEGSEQSSRRSESTRFAWHGPVRGASRAARPSRAPAPAALTDPDESRAFRASCAGAAHGGPRPRRRRAGSCHSRISTTTQWWAEAVCARALGREPACRHSAPLRDRLGAPAVLDACPTWTADALALWTGWRPGQRKPNPPEQVIPTATAARATGS
jgi:hypothetical protein